MIGLFGVSSFASESTNGFIMMNKSGSQPFPAKTTNGKEVVTPVERVDFVEPSSTGTSPTRTAMTALVAAGDAPYEEEDTAEGEGIPVYFKLDKRMKRAIFRGAVLGDLHILFLSKYPELGWTLDALPPLYVMDKVSKVKYEVESVNDLYQFCVLEPLHLPGHFRPKTGFGYYGFKRKKLVIAMVGLPARGKTFIAQKVVRYLNWQGVPAKLFNVGQYRRHRLGAKQKASFFDPENESGMTKRLHMAVAAMDDLVDFLDNNGGRVAIYDATNSTERRQQLIQSRCDQESFDLMWVESICNDSSIIEHNILQTKLNSPDYDGVSPDVASSDFKKRIGYYETAYRTIEDPNATYVKIHDVGRKVEVNNVSAYLESKIVFFLMNLHTVPRRIYLTRHGQSCFNAEGRIGGDTDLTELGEAYAQKVGEWVVQQVGFTGPLTVWTSTLKRTIQTAQYIPKPKLHLRALDEIDAGLFDGLTYEEIADEHPEEFKLRSQDKLHYRYPRGESYVDVIQRLEPVMFELERQRTPVLIVAHRAVIRALYAYFMNRDPEECPYIAVPLHTLIELQPKAYGCVERKMKLMDAAADGKPPGE